MDDFLSGADLCEEYRFLGQARLLRAMAGDGGRLYFLAERGAEYNDWCDYVPDTDGTFRTVFLDRDSAQRAADLGNARKFREIDIAEFGGVDDMSSLDGPALLERIGLILGRPFALNLDRRYSEAFTFPETATDDQMVAIAALFDKLRFFHVIEAEFGG